MFHCLFISLSSFKLQGLGSRIRQLRLTMMLPLGTLDNRQRNCQSTNHGTLTKSVENPNRTTKLLELCINTSGRLGSLLLKRLLLKRLLRRPLPLIRLNCRLLPIWMLHCLLFKIRMLHFQLPRVKVVSISAILISWPQIQTKRKSLLPWKVSTLLRSSS